MKKNLTLLTQTSNIPSEYFVFRSSVELYVFTCIIIELRKYIDPLRISFFYLSYSTFYFFIIIIICVIFITFTFVFLGSTLPLLNFSIMFHGFQLYTFSLVMFATSGSLYPCSHPTSFLQILHLNSQFR